MAHVYYHCGVVGDKLDLPEADFPTWSKGVIMWRLEVDDKKLEKRIERRARRMAEKIAAELGGQVQDQTTVNGYCSIGIGEIVGTERLETHYGSDYFIMQWFQSGEDHAKASALDTVLSIQRYESYMDVYDVTGREIHTY